MSSSATPERSAAMNQLWDWLLSDDELPDPQPVVIVPPKLRPVKDDDA